MRLSPYAPKEEFLFIIGPLAIAGLITYFGSPLVWWETAFVVFFIVFSGFAASFFRHPKRRIIKDDNTLYSPADGVVSHIEELPRWNEWLDQPCIRISIFLSVFNVHLNRYAANGTVAYKKYQSGQFKNAMSADSGLRNEHNEIGIETVPVFEKYIIRQIAGLIARRIVMVDPIGFKAEQGATFGMIKFGSRTDLIFPASSNIQTLIKIGDTVKGGITPLVRHQS